VLAYISFTLKWVRFHCLEASLFAASRGKYSELENGSVWLLSKYFHFRLKSGEVMPALYLENKNKTEKEVQIQFQM
jgi:hypothetical protein